jgi:Holliday junction DNA helicase RuvA
VREVAISIEEQDAKSLIGLPGIGPAMADKVIAALRRKVPKFALMVAREEPQQADVAHDVVDETFAVLRQLGHSEADARRMIESALSAKKKYNDVQDLITAVYQQTQK